MPRRAEEISQSARTENTVEERRLSWKYPRREWYENENEGFKLLGTSTNEGGRRNRLFDYPSHHMPVFPIGGLTLIINVLILFIGGFLRLLAYFGISLSPLWHRLIAPENDSLPRRMFSWSMAISVLIFVFSGMLGTLIFFAQHGSNYALLADTFEYRRAIAKETEGDTDGRRDEKVEISPVYPDSGEFASFPSPAVLSEPVSR